MRAIRPGSKIGTVSLSSPLHPDQFRRGVSALESFGYQVVCPLDPTENYGIYTHGFSCASAKARAAAFMSLVENPEIDAIVLVRGGYGVNEILELLDYKKIAEESKLVCGFSDVTLLLCAIAKLSEIPAIHGFTISRFGDVEKSVEAQESALSLINMLSSSDYRVSMEGEELRGGKAEGPIIVGNLSVLESLIGTPWDIDFSGAILVLEDINEPAYKVHRSLMHLKQAGKLKNLAALCYGQFTPPEHKFGPTVEDVLNGSLTDILCGSAFPVLKGLAVGHVDKNLPLPLLVRGQIESGRLVTIQSPLDF